MKLTLILLLALLINACATLSEGECEQADWQRIGYQDGEDGYPLSRLSKHHKACNKYGIKTQDNLYKQGRIQGLKKYCVAENGLEEGLKGFRYQDVCPPSLESAFLKKYTQGKAIHDLQKEIATLRKNISDIEKKLTDNQHTHKLNADTVSNLQYDKKILQGRVQEKQNRLYYLKGKAGIGYD